MYKITFELNSHICFIDLPIFDSILSYCLVKDKLGNVEKKLQPTKEEIDFYNNFFIENLPIKLHEHGYFMASFMFFDENINYTGSWKKRWCNKFDYIADFGKNKRQIEIDKGQFKSYDMPLNLYSISKVWFYFDSDNIKEVERLISKYLFGIGKKSSQGYGEIKEVKIDLLDYNPFDTVIRPIPIKNLSLSDNEKTKLILDGSLKQSCVRPPYWLHSEMEMCIVK